MTLAFWPLGAEDVIAKGPCQSILKPFPQDVPPNDPIKQSIQLFGPPQRAQMSECDIRGWDYDPFICANICYMVMISPMVAGDFTP